MPPRRTRLNWIYDNDLQQFATPSGRVISLHEIAAMLQDQVTCSHDLQGPWIGWRIRQNRLIAPGATFRSSSITPQTLRAFTRWLSSYQGEQAQLEFRNEPHQENCGPPPRASLPGPLANTAARYGTQPDQQPSDAAHAGAAPYESRRRAEVIELAAYRKLAR
jgi:hypothetical protein